jgi:hypothetical protein
MRSPDKRSDPFRQLAIQHRTNLAECAPLLDPSIPLGVVMVSPSERDAIERYYRAKHGRGEYGRYFLHHVGTWKGGMHDLRRGKGRD